MRPDLPYARHKRTFVAARPGGLGDERQPPVASSLRVGSGVAGSRQVVSSWQVSSNIRAELHVLNPGVGWAFNFV